jgi:hypothetical protein
VVQVIYGSALGLLSADNQLWSQSTSGIVDTAEPFDNFGYALAAGDFDNDGKSDLAIGVPGEDTIEAVAGATLITNAGQVHVLLGSTSGLTSALSQVWTQNSSGISDENENGDMFGQVLAAGDFNEDGVDDLAVGVPSEDLTLSILSATVLIIDAGAVHALYGFNLTGIGLTAAGNQFWTQNTGTIQDLSETGDKFGSALAVGDFNGDNEADLAVGVPFEDVTLPHGAITVTYVNAGVVNVIYGSPSLETINGLTDDGNQLWHQASTDIADAPENDDRFGQALAAGRFNCAGLDGLAIGVPGEDILSAAGLPVIDAGLVHILYGAGPGLVASGSQWFTQDTPFVDDVAETNDRFGASLASR